MGKRKQLTGLRIIKILTLALAVSQQVKSRPRNPFLAASEAGIDLPEELTGQYKSFQAQTVSLNAKWKNLKAIQESNSAIDFSMNEKEKCDAWLGRFQRKWHQKKIELDDKIWNMENSHSRTMLGFTDYSKHKQIVTQELQTRKQEFEVIKQEAQDERRQMEKRLAELRQRLAKVRNEYYRVSEETIETQQKLDIVEKKIVEKREEIKTMKNVEKLKLSMFFMEENIIETRIRVMNGKCNVIKKTLEDKLSKVYNVKSQVEAHVSMFQGKKPEPVEPVEIPESLKKMLKATKIKKKEDDGLGEEQEPETPHKEFHVDEDDHDVEGVKVNDEKNTRDLLKQTLARLKKKKAQEASLFGAFIPKKKKHVEAQPMVKQPQPNHPQSNLFSSFTHPKKPHSAGLFSSFHQPKKVGEYKKKSSSLLGSLMKPKKKHSLFGGLMHHTKERYNTRHVSTTESTSEERPAGQRVTYVVNGKEISEEEFQKMKKKGAKVKEERHTEHLKPVEQVITEEVPAEQTKSEPVYEINGKQITQSQYLEMKRKGLVD